MLFEGERSYKEREPSYMQVYNALPEMEHQEAIGSSFRLAGMHSTRKRSRMDWAVTGSIRNRKVLRADDVSRRRHAVEAPEQ